MSGQKLTPAWPLVVDAKRLLFHLTKDRSHFLLTVHSQSDPPVSIQFPLAFLPDLLEQLDNVQRVADKAPEVRPSNRLVN